MLNLQSDKFISHYHSYPWPMRTIVLLTFTLYTCLVNAQLIDDFSDGDFTNNPSWMGDTDAFTVDEGLLKLNDASAQGNNLSFLSVLAATSAVDSTTWSFSVRLDFAPSSGNNARVYLSSNSSNLDGELNGYFLQIGGISGSMDSLEFFRQDGATTVKLAGGRAGAVGNDPVMVAVQVIRDTDGNWTFLTDYDSSGNPSEEFTASDLTYDSGQFFGFYCQYTATRSENFSFDDVFINPLFVDRAAPVLLSAAAQNDSTIVLEFDEAILEAGLPAAFFEITPDVGPLNTTVNTANSSQVILRTTTPLSSEIEYTVSVSGLADRNGNIAEEQSAVFTFLDIRQPLPSDLIITEILADPTPAVGLPEFEFFELYNASDKILQLDQLLVSSGTGFEAFPPFLLFPGAYVSVCDVDALPDFQALGMALGIKGFPTLTNGGDEIVIINIDQDTIFSINYDDAWYDTKEAASGGVSLEIIQLEGPIECPGNWIASRAASGGTPGQENTALNFMTEKDAPFLIGLRVENTNTIQITFNEVMDANTVSNPDNYQIAPTVRVTSVVPADDNTFRLQLSDAIAPGTIYTLTITDLVSDCLGNPLRDTTVRVGLSEPLAPGDLIITEILADPSPSAGLPDADFFEIYNRSDKIIQLANLQVGSGNTVGDLPEFLLFPQQYVAVCEAEALTEFTTYGPAIAPDRFPALSVAADDIRLEVDGITVFSVFYEDDWYDVDELSDGGYSLELIDLEGPTDCPGNWIASRSPNGGTPGQANTAAAVPQETVRPILLDLAVESSTEIRITFDEVMNDNTVLDVTSYSLDPSIEISSIIPGGNNNYLLLLESELQLRTAYNLIISSKVGDCIGNTLEENLSERIGLPEAIAPGDLLLNEVLFFPFVGSQDFVEFFNRSDKVINLKELALSNQLREEPDTVFIEKNIFAFPGDYVVLTEDTADLNFRYAVINPQMAFQVDDLPTFLSNEGNVTLLNGDEVIDAFDYLDDYHLSLLDDDRGVSLERISIDQATQNPDNWHSAAESVGFATPTGPNSQNFELPEQISGLVAIDNPRFSPDDDGFEDILLIQVEPGRQGFIANINIFDAQGRLVRELVQNTLVGNSALFKWDGLTNENSKARIGPYIVWVELFDENGNVNREKITVVVAGQLD